MADTPDLTTTPEKKTRKTTAPKATESTAAAPEAVSETRATAEEAATFADSATQARAALNTATAAARAKVKEMTDKASTDWKAQGDKMKVQGEQIREKASKLAHDTADSAKAYTGSTMQGLARLIQETAETVDTKLGPQYGDYARQAANAVAGAAKSLDEKDVDQLLGEARDFVRKSPAVAIGAAAVAGYVLMRLAKGGGSSDSSDE